MKLTNKVSGLLAKTKFKAMKYSPEILIIAGVAGVVVSAVMACKATTKVQDILDEENNELDTVENSLNKCSDIYSEEDAKKDRITIKVQTGVKLVKLYAPSITLGILSLTSIVVSNDILRKRNVALAAAYTTIDKSFKEYRHRVVDRFGDEIEHQIRYGTKPVEIEEEVTDENGKTKKVKKTINVLDENENPIAASEYARFFDELNPNYEKDSESNLYFLRAQEAYANDLLKVNGYLFLNSVYRMLGIPETRAGQIVGWLYNPDDPHCKGDNYVDFGLYNIHKPGCREFVNGYERSVLLDFNVDGDILNKFKEG